MDAHEHGHDGADGAGDAGGVGVEVGEVFVAAAGGVPGEAFEQARRAAGGGAVMLDDGGEGAVVGAVGGRPA